jgi:hypothetical protein
MVSHRGIGNEKNVGLGSYILYIIRGCEDLDSDWLLVNGVALLGCGLLTAVG